MRQLRWWTEVYTFKSSVMMSAEKVIVTILVNDSWKNMIVPSMITHPWKIDLKNQIKNVFVDSSLPIYKVAYSGGYFITVSTVTSWSNTRENTGREV